jgi:hypothetical protein
MALSAATILNASSVLIGIIPAKERCPKRQKLF